MLVLVTLSYKRTGIGNILALNLQIITLRWALRLKKPMVSGCHSCFLAGGGDTFAGAEPQPPGASNSRPAEGGGEGPGLLFELWLGCHGSHFIQGDGKTMISIGFCDVLALWMRAQSLFTKPLKWLQTIAQFQYFHFLWVGILCLLFWQNSSRSNELKFASNQ